MQDRDVARHGRAAYGGHEGVATETLAVIAANRPDGDGRWHVELRRVVAVDFFREAT